MSFFKNKKLIFLSLSLVMQIMTLLAADAFSANDFTGNWISRQFSNGREFYLKIEQDNKELRGWEGKYADIKKHPPDFSGFLENKTKALVQIQHRKGYSGKVILSLRKNKRSKERKLVWQLLESTDKNNVYLPLASTLVRLNTNTKNEPNSADSNTIMTSENMHKNIDFSAEFSLCAILKNASEVSSGLKGEQSNTNIYFDTYKALDKLHLAFDNKHLQELLEKGNTAGKIYAAILIWNQDKVAGLRIFEKLKDDHSNFKYLSGCEEITDQISNLAKSFIEQGKYLDFPAKQY